MDSLYAIKRKYSIKYYKTLEQAIKNIPASGDAEFIEFKVNHREDARKFKENHLTKKQRKDALDVILGNIPKYEELLFIKQVAEQSKDKSAKRIVEKFEKNGISIETFKKIITDYDSRTWLLYSELNSVEWYLKLMELHDFRNLDKFRYYNYSKQKVPQKNIENFEKAKLIKKQRK